MPLTCGTCHMPVCDRVRSGGSVGMSCGKWAVLSRDLEATPTGSEHSQLCRETALCHQNSFSARVNCVLSLSFPVCLRGWFRELEDAEVPTDVSLGPDVCLQSCCHPAWGLLPLSLPKKNRSGFYPLFILD